MRYAYKPTAEHARALGRSLRISPKHALVICRALSGQQLAKGKSLLEAVISGRKTIDGKHYFTNASEAILELLNSAEKNAEFKGLDLNRLIIHACVQKGFTFWRPRRFKLRRQQRRIAHVQITLEQK